jgi:acyl carrier protein
MTVFEIDADQLTDDLKYQSIKAWDSVGHMALMAELENLFDILLEMDDVVDFGSYNTGLKTLEKYGVSF